MSGQLKVGIVREITVKTEKEHTAKCFYENLPDIRPEMKLKKSVKQRMSAFIIKPKKLISRLAKKKAK